ncbi:hypothetical protein QQP08_023868 [Theobroma cacao]|nr:hypothetical protein QQP08_023868 [Theobroma cacao]
MVAAASLSPVSPACLRCPTNSIWEHELGARICLSNFGFFLKVTVCQTCGDRGFSVAFIYCDKCQAYAVHRYCLDKLPATLEEYVVWFCVDCEPKVAELSTLQQALPAIGFQLRLKEGNPVRKLKGENDIKELKKNKKNNESEYDSGSLAISEVQRQSSPSLLRPENLEKDETLRRSLEVGRPSSDKEARPFEAEILSSNTCSSSRVSDWVNRDEEAESANIRTSLVAINDHLNVIEHSPLDPRQRQLDGVYSDEAADNVKTKTTLVATSNQIPKHYYVPARPIFEPIWRGSFRLYDENLAVGIVAHLSSLACFKVCEMAKCLPESLFLELLPRCDVWPKGFKKWGPSEESIALYFFPNDERDVKIFYNLVDKVIVRDLGMRAVVQDVELLVFTSNILPLRLWRFQEKFYLWGVFRAKQASHLTNVVHGEEKNPLKALTCNPRSPISPLSDRGISISG